MRDGFVERYYRAFGDGDLDAVVADYAPDAEYRLHGVWGSRTWAGVDACRAVYAEQMRAWPDQDLEPRSVVASGDLLVCDVRLTGTLVAPWELAGRTYQPTRCPIAFDIVHVIRFEDELVKTIDGWVDGLGIHNRLIEFSAPPSG